jgi:hypothetical protein
MDPYAYRYARAESSFCGPTIIDVPRMLANRLGILIICCSSTIGTASIREYLSLSIARSWIESTAEMCSSRPVPGKASLGERILYETAEAYLLISSLSRISIQQNLLLTGYRTEQRLDNHSIYLEEAQATPKPRWPKYPETH